MFCEITMTGSSYVWKALVDGTGFLGILQMFISYYNDFDVDINR